MKLSWVLTLLVVFACGMLLISAQESATKSINSALNDMLASATKKLTKQSAPKIEAVKKKKEEKAEIAQGILSTLVRLCL